MRIYLILNKGYKGIRIITNLKKMICLVWGINERN